MYRAGSLHVRVSVCAQCSRATESTVVSVWFTSGSVCRQIAWNLVSVGWCWPVYKTTATHFTASCFWKHMNPPTLPHFPQHTHTHAHTCVEYMNWFCCFLRCICFLIIIFKMTKICDKLHQYIVDRETFQTTVLLLRPKDCFKILHLKICTINCLKKIAPTDLSENRIFSPLFTVAHKTSSFTFLPNQRFVAP